MSAITSQPTGTARFRNGAEWMEALGDVPLERIIFDPWPGTATEADLLRKIEVEDQICELIDGTLVEKAMGFYESVLAMILIQELLNFIRPRNLGVVGGGDGPLRLRLNLVRLPDVSFISSARFVQRAAFVSRFPRLSPIWRLKFSVRVTVPGR